MTRPDVIARVSGLRLAYGQTEALRGIDFSIAEGEAVGVVGRSGSGKSSLLACLAGLTAPTGGTVVVDGIDVVRSGRATIADLRRRRLGFVFQFAELIPELTLRENIELPLELTGMRSRKERKRTSAGLIERLGIADSVDRRAAEVSGGQRQRAAIARALVHGPAVVFADEPTGSLDTANADAVSALLCDEARVRGAALVLVTHQPEVAARCDRIVTLADGVIVSDVSTNVAVT